MKTLPKFSSVRFRPRYIIISIRSGLSYRQVYKAETLDRIDGVERPYRVRRRLRAGVLRYASADAVTLTTPSQRHAGREKMASPNSGRPMGRGGWR